MLIQLFPKVLRSFSFRAVATVFIVILLILFSNFLITVYRANALLKTELGPQWEPLLRHLESVYFYGLVSLGLLTFIVIAAIVDLFAFMRTTREFRTVSRTIVNFAAGDLTLRVQNIAQGPMGELQRSFNKMADTIVQNIQKLEDVSQLRRELVANVAHDLGGPVTSILGYIDTIRLKADTITKQELGEYLEIARSNALFLSKLVGELSDLSRFDTDSIPFNSQPFDIQDLTLSVINRFNVAFKSRGVMVSHSFPAEKTRVLGDPVMIERVISNLVENAIHYSGPEGGVEVSCEAEGDRMQIRIRDDGVGIPEEDQPFVFERFYRVDKDRSRVTGGSGLGLAIVKKALELHDSSVRLESASGEGTSIYFDLPLA